MHTIQLFAKAIPEQWIEPPPCKPEVGICCITGVECLTIPRSKLITSTFTDHSKMVAPNSSRISVDAWYTFKAGYFSVDPETGLKKKRKKQVERMACWWTDGEKLLVELDRDKQQIRDLLFDPPSTKWAGYITTSYKKHGSLRATVNNSYFGRWGFDDYIVDASSKDRVYEWWGRIREAQEVGIPKQVIEEIPSNWSAKQESLLFWIEFSQWALQRREDPLFKFLCYLLPAQKELKLGYKDDHTKRETPKLKQAELF